MTWEVLSQPSSLIIIIKVTKVLLIKEDPKAALNREPISIDHYLGGLAGYHYVAFTKIS
jgi:hypothetical protein